MKNESSLSPVTLQPKPFPLIKLLSLALAAWGVLYHGWIDMLGAAWLVWLVLALLMLLEAGGAESRPAVWSQWTAVLGRIFNPAMLPFYGALCLLLAVGPSYVNKTPAFSLPTKANGLPNRLDDTPGLRPAHIPGSLNAPPISSLPQRPMPPFGSPPRPGTLPPANAFGPQPALAKPATNPQAANSFTPNPAAPKPASPFPSSGPPKTFKRPELIQPSSSARPAPATTNPAPAATK